MPPRYETARKGYEKDKISYFTKVTSASEVCRDYKDVDGKTVKVVQKQFEKLAYSVTKHITVGRLLHNRTLLLMARDGHHVTYEELEKVAMHSVKYYAPGTYKFDTPPYLFTAAHQLEPKWGDYIEAADGLPAEVMSGTARRFSREFWNYTMAYNAFKWIRKVCQEAGVQQGGYRDSVDGVLVIAYACGWTDETLVEAGQEPDGLHRVRLPAAAAMLRAATAGEQCIPSTDGAFQWVYKGLNDGLKKAGKDGHHDRAAALQGAIDKVKAAQAAAKQSEQAWRVEAAAEDDAVVDDAAEGGTADDMELSDDAGDASYQPEADETDDDGSEDGEDAGGPTRSKKRKARMARYRLLSCLRTAALGLAMTPPRFAPWGKPGQLNCCTFHEKGLREGIAQPVLDTLCDAQLAATDPNKPWVQEEWMTSLGAAVNDKDFERTRSALCNFDAMDKNIGVNKEGHETTKPTLTVSHTLQSNGDAVHTLYMKRTKGAKLPEGGVKPESEEAKAKRRREARQHPKDTAHWKGAGIDPGVSVAACCNAKEPGEDEDGRPIANVLEIPGKSVNHVLEKKKVDRQEKKRQKDLDRKLDGEQVQRFDSTTVKSGNLEQSMAYSTTLREQVAVLQAPEFMEARAKAKRHLRLHKQRLPAVLHRTIATHYCCTKARGLRLDVGDACGLKLPILRPLMKLGQGGFKNCSTRATGEGGTSKHCYCYGQIVVFVREEDGEEFHDYQGCYRASCISAGMEEAVPPATWGRSKEFFTVITPGESPIAVFARDPRSARLIQEKGEAGNLVDSSPWGKSTPAPLKLRRSREWLKNLFNIAEQCGKWA